MRYGTCMCSNVNGGKTKILPYNVYTFIFFFIYRPYIFITLIHVILHTRDGYLIYTIITNKYIVNCNINCNHALIIFKLSNVENNNCVNKISIIIHEQLLSIAIAVCMCSSVILVYCHANSLEVYMLLLYFNIQVICMYNTCILIIIIIFI